jgi:hypothetical protein
LEHSALPASCDTQARYRLGLLGGDEGRVRAEEWVDDGVAAVGEVEKRIFEKANRPPRFARDRGVWVK